MKQSIRILGVAALLAAAPYIATSAVPTAVLYADAAANTTLAAKVKAQLDAETELQGSEITVSAQDGVVTLTGVATSAVQRVKAVETAKAIDGVAKVTNKVKIARK